MIVILFINAYLLFTNASLQSDYAIANKKIGKLEKKLDNISETIKLLVNNNRNILVCCENGYNKSILVVGYYLITVKKSNYNKVINQLEYIYKDNIKCLALISHRKILKLISPDVKKNQSMGNYLYH